MATVRELVQEPPHMALHPVCPKPNASYSILFLQSMTVTKGNPLQNHTNHLWSRTSVKNTKRMKELIPLVPLSCIITPTWVHVKAEQPSTPTTLNSPVMSSSPRRRSLQSNSSTDQSTKSSSCQIRLREKFENFLDRHGELVFEKLEFLDEFYDPRRQRMRTIKNHQEVWESCERLLVLHCKKCEIPLRSGGMYPHLMQVEELKTPLLTQHEMMSSWFKQQKELAQLAISDPTENSQFTEHDVPASEEFPELKQLVFIMHEELEDLFSFFQKQKTKSMKKWLDENLSTMPKYMLELIQKKHNRYLQFHDHYKMSEEDLNTKTILYADYDFLNYMAEHTEDWSVLFDDHAKWKGYKSKENYTKIPNMKMQKLVMHLDYSIEHCAKALMFGNMGEEMTLTEKYHAYQSLDKTSSTRKYSTVIHTSIFDYGSIFRKRSLENVVSSNATFQNGKLSQFVHIYKTCSYVNEKNDDSETPLKIIIVGGRIFTKLDTRVTRCVDVRMFNVGGFMNSDLVVHTLGGRKTCESIYTFFMKQLKGLEEGTLSPANTNEHMIWKTFVEYCQAHYNVDPSTF